MLKNILVGLVCLSLFPVAGLADGRHHRDYDRDNHHHNRSHRGAWIAGAAVLGGLVGYSIANNRETNSRTILAYCENRVPPRYSSNRRLSKEWVRGCVERTQAELDARAEEAYADGYNNEY